MKNTRSIFLIRVLTAVPLLTLLGFWLLDERFAAYLREGLDFLLAGDQPGLQAWATKGGAGPWLGTSLLMILQALLFPIPAILVTATNSLLYGWVAGGLLSIVQATFAAWLCYGIARVFGASVVSAFVSPKALRRCDGFLERHGSETIILSRLIPFIPFDVVSFAAGLTRMRPWTFVWATFVGQIPAGMAYAWLTVQVADHSSAWALAPVVFAALLVIGFIARRTLRARRVKTDAASCVGAPDGATTKDRDR